MDNKKDRIASEIRRADDYLNAAYILHKSGLYTPAVSSAYMSAMHAAIAAFLTRGAHNPGTDGCGEFAGMLGKFNKKLDPLVERLQSARVDEGDYSSIEYRENESMLRLYQTKEFLLEIKDFLKRAVKYE